MGLTTMDVSTWTQRRFDEARARWDETGDWRDYRRMCVLYADKVHFDRPNGMGAVPFVNLHPAMGDDSIDLANWRWLVENLEGTEEWRIAHWATDFVALSFPLTRANLQTLSGAARSLADCAILDDGSLSQVEMEMIDESVDAYAAADLLRELRDLGVHSDADTGHVTESLPGWLEAIAEYPEVTGSDVRWPDADETLLAMVNRRALEEYGPDDDD